MANRLYLRKKIEFSELDWNRAVAITERRITSLRQGSSDQSSSRGAAAVGFSLRVACRKMQDNFRGPLSLRWFRSLRITPIESELIKAICETQGADELTISSRYALRIFGASLVQDIHIAPFARGEDARQIKTFRISLKLSDKRAPVTLGAPVVLALNLLLVLVGVILAAISLGLLFWGLAVFIVFIRSPLGMTSSALNRIDLWIALLCVLSGISSIIGSLLRRIHGKIRSDSAD